MGKDPSGGSKFASHLSQIMARHNLALFLGVWLVILGGCGEDASEIRIGVSVPETTGPTYTLMRRAMIELGKEHGIKILWKGVQDEGPKQDSITREVEQVREMLEGGIRVLVYKAGDGKSAFPVVQAARRREVPVITLDRLLSGIQVHGHIAVNASRLGEVAAQYAAEKIGYTGNVLILEAPISVDYLRNISIGIYRVFEQYPEAIRVRARSSALDSNAALRLSDQALKQARHPARFTQQRFASIGPVTSSAVRALGGRVAVEAGTSTVEGLIESIVRDGRALRRRTKTGGGHHARC